eukprot:3261846-Pyramimonas_sp.AAC.1
MDIGHSKYGHIPRVGQSFNQRGLFRHGESIVIGEPQTTPSFGAGMLRRECYIWDATEGMVHMGCYVWDVTDEMLRTDVVGVGEHHQAVARLQRGHHVVIVPRVEPDVGDIDAHPAWGPLLGLLIPHQPHHNGVGKVEDALLEGLAHQERPLLLDWLEPITGREAVNTQLENQSQEGR